MRKFRLSPEAIKDITEIFEYIALDSPDAAERVRVEIYKALQSLVAMPGKGHKREDLTASEVLFWPVYSYSGDLSSWNGPA